jgi:hypothetical protein
VFEGIAHLKDLIIQRLRIKKMQKQHGLM